MSVSRLDVTAVRNLRQVRLTGFGPINVFYGENGSGKTSLLESIHLLGMARSFRGNSIKTVITHGAPECTVFGMISSATRPDVPVGITRKQEEIKFDGHQFVRKTFPLMLAKAMTIHRCQGASITGPTLMDFRAVFAPGMGYVMLSRKTFGKASSSLLSQLHGSSPL